MTSANNARRLARPRNVMSPKGKPVTMLRGAKMGLIMTRLNLPVKSALSGLRPAMLQIP